MKSIVGMMIFTQHWYSHLDRGGEECHEGHTLLGSSSMGHMYWYSYLLLLSLTFQPTADLCEAEEYRRPIHQWELKDVPMAGGGPEGDEDKEPEPPEPFEWP